MVGLSESCLVVILVGWLLYRLDIYIYQMTTEVWCFPPFVMEILK